MISELRKIKKGLFIGILISFFGCVQNTDFDIPKAQCLNTLIPNVTYAEVKNLYVDQTIQIHEDLIIEGYVVSSDQAGNFFGKLHFQDSLENPKEGLQIEIDLRQSHLFYPIGTKIWIKLRGLYLGKRKEVFTLGGFFSSFGNISVGRLPITVLDNHVLIACDEHQIPNARVLDLENLDESLTNTLIQINGVEVVDDELGEVFAMEGEVTKRTLVDCNNNRIVMLNSGFSDFQSDQLPEGNGSITGILLREKNKYQIAIRQRLDVDMKNERCEVTNPSFTSKEVFISELADPNNNTNARFIEIYNGGAQALNLKGWSLVRYTNANDEADSVIDLTGNVIKSQSTLIISPNAEEFEDVYGFPPHIEADRNSAADSNGDDNIELVDPFGEVIDVFGIVGEDGSGTNHEFQNGKAIRKETIKQGNPVYTFNEWTIYNDSGFEGTINSPQIAPEDFAPGTRN